MKLAVLAATLSVAFSLRGMDNTPLKEVFSIWPEARRLAEDEDAAHKADVMLKAYIKREQDAAIPDFDRRCKQEEERLTYLAFKRKKTGFKVTALADITNFRILGEVSQGQKERDPLLLDLKDRYLETISPCLPRPLLSVGLGKALTGCDLSHNNLHILPLYILLKEWPNLEKLIVHNNKITSIEVRNPHNGNSFLERNNTNLGTIDIGHNRIKDAEPVKKMLECYYGLHTLILNDNPLPPEMQKYIVSYATGLFHGTKNNTFSEVSEDKKDGPGVKMYLFQNDNRRLHITCDRVIAS
jgi:hypothetical protein